CFRERRHIWRRNAMHRFCRELVGEWWREIICQPAGTLGRRALVVKILNLGLGRYSRRLCFAEAGTAWLREIAEGNHRHGMTDCTDFLVDLEAALQLPLVIFPEGPGKRPLVSWWCDLLFGRRRQDQRGKRAGQGEANYGASQN